MYRVYKERVNEDIMTLGLPDKYEQKVGNS